MDYLNESTKKIGILSLGEAPKKSKYQLLAEVIKEEIIQMEEGALLDPEAKLIERFDASRNTLRSAMAVLRQEGLIASRAGYGTYKLSPHQASFKKKSLLAIMPSRQGSFWYRLMDGLHDGLGTGTPYQLIYSYSGDQHDKISSILTEAYHSDVAGIVLMALYEADQVYHLDQSELQKPTVLVHNKHPEFKGSFVGTDEKATFKQLLKRVWDAGIKDFHFFGGASCSSHAWRKEAFIEAMDEWGIDLHVYQVGVKENDGYSFMMEKWPSLSSSAPTCVCAISDDVALGVTKACRELNIEIGKDLWVTGYGNLYESNFVSEKLDSSALLTVEQHPHRLGKMAMSALLAEIEGRNKPGRELLLPGDVVHMKI